MNNPISATKERRRIRRVESRVLDGGGSAFDRWQDHWKTCRPDSTVALQETLEEYLRPVAHRSARWWIRSPGELRDPRSGQTARQWKEHVIEAFSICQQASPSAARIASRVSGFLVSVGLPDRSESLTELADELGPEPLEICFVPQDSRSALQFPISYDHRRQSICMHAIEWPRIVLAAVLFHELHHAYAGRTYAWSATAPAGSVDAAAGELAAHRVETEVFDFLTGGAYSRALDDILARHHVWNWDHALRSLGASDLEILDELVGSRVAGLDVMQLCVAQHVIALGCRCIDRKAGEDELQVRFDEVQMFHRLAEVLTTA